MKFKLTLKVLTGMKIYWIVLASSTQHQFQSTALHFQLMTQNMEVIHSVMYKTIYLGMLLCDRQNSLERTFALLLD